MVEIQITGVRYHASDKVRDYISEKLGSLDRFHPALRTLHVTIHEEANFGFRVDVDMHLPNHKDVVAHDSEETIYAAIDTVADKCGAQLRKIHSKENDRSRQSDRQRARA